MNNTVSLGLVSGTYDYLAELREVTTMFMSWDSYDEVKHKDLLSLQKFYITAQKVLNESGAFVRQFLIDDKGCVLIACWGVPLASHHDNTRRALIAGSKISESLSMIDMEISIGITTGNVFCGTVGSFVRREYAVIGDVVNLAARLMSKAKGGLYIDSATYSRIPLYLQKNLQEEAPMLLKGNIKEIITYSLKQNSTRMSFNIKDEEKKTVSIRPVCKGPLMNGMETLLEHKPVLMKYILLEGKETGKSEVVDWLRFNGPKLGIRVVGLLMIRENSNTQYHMVAQLFRLLLGELTYDDVAARDKAISRMLQNIYRGDMETIEKVRFLVLILL
jgi:hypothetical protein